MRANFKKKVIIRNINKLFLKCYKMSLHITETRLIFVNHFIMIFTYIVVIYDLYIYIYV